MTRVPKQENSGRMRMTWRGHSMGSELLDFNVLNSDHIQHQPRSAATWTLPHIVPLSPRTHYTRACGHQLTSPTLPCSWPAAVLVGDPTADVALEEPKSRQPHPNTHTDIGINGVQSCCDDDPFFQVPSDIPISLRRPHRTSVRVLISVVGMD